MTAHDWAGLVISAIGGGLIGWCYTQVRDAWKRRPVVVWDYEHAQWRSARIVMEEREHGYSTPHLP